MASILLTIFGLLFDIVGVIGLFRSISKGFTKIQNIYPPLANMGFYGFGISNPEQNAILELKKDLNIIIDTTNERNEQIHKKSEKWLFFIVLGFILQIIGLIIQLIPILKTT